MKYYTLEYYGDQNMFLGEVIKNTRLELGLSQTELAAGICTQAVISKIEKKNIYPSIDILINLGQRLDLTLNDLFSEYSSLPSKNLVNDKLNKVDTLIQNSRADDGLVLVKSISEEDLSTNQQIHLHYQLARLAFLSADYDEAVFEYNFSLGMISNMSNSFDKYLIYVGLALIYRSQHDSAKMAHYLDLAIKSFTEFNIETNSDYFYYLESIVELADYLIQESQFDGAKKIVDLGLKNRDGYLSARFTDQLYYLSSVLSLNGEANKQAASHSLTMAIAFADYNDNQPLLNKIDQLMQKNSIRELKIKP